MNNMNPLSNYTKVEKVYTKLITNNVIEYPKGVLGKDGIECGVCARSARDELMFNNPEALMNGAAVSNVIENCVRNVDNARKLLLPDVEILLISIKLATNEKTQEIETKCPNCHKEGAFERDLNYLLNTATYFEEEPYIDMDGGLIVYLKPHTWEEHSKFALKMFEVQKQVKIFEEIDQDNLSEKDIEQMAKIFELMAQVQFDMMIKNISKIELPDDKQTVVTDTKFIKEWVEELPKCDLQKIMEKTEEMNKIGISHELDAKCSDCGHEWTITNIQFDPTSFFTDGFSMQNQKK